MLEGKRDYVIVLFVTFDTALITVLFCLCSKFHQPYYITTFEVQLVCAGPPARRWKKAQIF